MKDFFDHIKDGVSQTVRYLPALHPSYVRMEDRSTADLLMQLMEFSKLLKYYNLNNEADGHWQEFLEGDMLIVLQYISRLDFTSYQSAQQQIRHELENAANEQQLQEGLTALFDLMYSIAMLLGKQLKLARNADVAAEYWNYIDQVMDSLENDVYQLLLYEKQAGQLFRPGTVLRHIDPVPLFSKSAKRAAEDNEGITFLGYESLNEVYNSLRAKFYQVTSAANRQLLLVDENHQHHPHIGLLLAFLELYKHLQEQLNQLTDKHLEYYYKTVLGIPYRPAMPDYVHVILVPMPHVPNQLIPEHTLFPADLVKGAPPVLFRCLFDVPVTQARMKILRTVFVGHHRQLAARKNGQQDMVETQVYMKTHQIPVAAAYLPDAPPVQSWAMLGEEQAELTENARTMDELAMGWVLASPVLYLKEGIRTITIRLCGTADSFKTISDYISNLSAIMDRKEDAIKGDLLSSAFRLYYTAPECWQQVKHYTARFNADNSISLVFVLDMTAPASVIYNPKIHGESFASSLPMVKVLLNNTSFHHPHSYLKYFHLERITLHAKVSGFRSLQLQNNVGPLSAANPFQLFGPSPAVGSFLQLRDTNVFNKYTRKFCVQLEWLDLPQEKGGFDTWYAAYNADMRNASFKVSLSNMRDGKFQPAKDKRQTFRLFDDDLSDKTDLDQIDFIRINFNNAPLMEKESLAGYYADGAVRLELTAPDVAFGQRLYTQIFPEVVTHNANRWAKKKPIPNPPYIPLIKAITVDYELEHTEVLTGETVTDNSRPVELYHIYPFGHRKAYPRSGESDYTLLPQLDHAANLYIGLENVKPQEYLSFLFQLEEKNYSNTTGTLQTYHWSYLHDDKWLPLPPENLLADATQSFIQSGIVLLKMPRAEAGGLTRLEPGLQWLRLSSTSAPATKPMIKGIFLNAGVVRREQADTAFGTNLPPLSIKSLQKEVKGIQQVFQFFPSFGGRPAETKDEYYVRVSERLRHKGRPLLGIDIIQLVMEQFPDILMAKTMGNDVHTGADLQLVVVPRQQLGMEVPEPRADLATLYNIRNYVKGLLPAYMEVAVHNPVYERVKVICDVCFNSNNSHTDNSYYLYRLQEDIRHFLSPWIFDKGAELSIGGKIYKSDMISFIKKLPYVGNLTAFSLVHFFSETDPRTGDKLHYALDTALEDVEYIMPSTPEAVLIPALHHSIRVENEWEYRDPAPMGISGMITGEEMIVGRKILAGYQHQTDIDTLDGEMIRLTIHSK